MSQPERTPSKTPHIKSWPPPKPKQNAGYSIPSSFTGTSQGSAFSWKADWRLYAVIWIGVGIGLLAYIGGWY
jgi:hypothetical protein